MLCLTNSPARRGLRLLRPARRRSRKSADILRCDEFSHEACGREFTFWIERFGYLARCWRAGENIAWGTGGSATRALDLHAPGCTPPGTARTSSAPTGRSASACESARLEGNAGAHVWTQDFGAAADAVLSFGRMGSASHAA